MPSADRYAVIGHPIAHSRSPQIYALFAQQTGQALTYDAIDVSPSDLTGWLPRFFAAGGRGLNVTVPHKQAVLGLLSRLAERARLAGAVNTLLATATGLEGDNTDGVGLTRDLQRLRIPVTDQRVLVLGAGGAVRGVLPALLQLRPQHVVICNRTAATAEQLVAQFSHLGPLQSLPPAQLDGSFGLILNATAAGLDGAAPECPAPVAHHAVCYDLNYGRNAAPFLDWARRAGLAAHDGLGMLVEQAAESFYLWRGVQPLTAPVLDRLRASLT